MGLSFIKSCGTNYTYSTPQPYKPPAPPPNPDPKRWRIVERIQFPHAHVLKVHYLDCTNFEGLKVMVYRGTFAALGERDPHFTPDDGVSPIARFRPDDEGWGLACVMAAMLRPR